MLNKKVIFFCVNLFDFLSFYLNIDVKGLGLDVVFLMIDSQSNANFHRHLNKSMNRLLNDEDTIILNGHTIVGDGTTAQLAGILTGLISFRKHYTILV